MKFRVANFSSFIFIATILLSCKFFQNSKKSSVKTDQEMRTSGGQYINFPSAKFSRVLFGKTIIPAGGSTPISYGLEYEGGSPKIWEYFGQDSQHFFEHTHLWTCKQTETMIDWLMTELVTNNRAIREITHEGQKMRLEESALPAKYSSQLPISKKHDFFEEFIDNSHNSPMSFMPWEMRYQWINQWPLKQVFLEAKKQDASCGLKRKDFMQTPYNEYKGLELLLGLDATQLALVKKEEKGWEINTKPVYSRDEFEDQLAWFENHFGSVAHQHKRIVIPCGTICNSVTQYENFAVLSAYVQILLYLIELEHKSEIVGARASSLSLFIGLDNLPYDLSRTTLGWGSAITTRFNEIPKLETHYSAEIRAGLGSQDTRDFIFGFFQKWAISGGHLKFKDYRSETTVFQSMFPTVDSILAENALTNLQVNKANFEAIQSGFAKSILLRKRDNSQFYKLPVFWGWQNLPTAQKHLPKIFKESNKFAALFVDKNGQSKVVDKETTKQALSDWVRNTEVIKLLSEYVWED